MPVCSLWAERRGEVGGGGVWRRLSKLFFSREQARLVLLSLSHEVPACGSQASPPGYGQDGQAPLYASGSVGVQSLLTSQAATPAVPD